ncbi:MAG: UDP-glucose/iron transport system permease protein [Anaerophaga sp.]|uniref:ABC transporter permease n=1 Tax=Anaerophaga thermohalophila TaxID=177400 RepID=UPI000237D205|nr:ABC transporter permease [Anaerophaga thermohalophila]MDN5291930.1 UDP-glucose/iron transport system permease protein [Anaerophaga sp.]
MIDIGIWKLILGFSILVIPLLVFMHYRIRLIKDMFVSTARMVIQLALVAVYMEWIFDKNNAWINSLWVIIMVLVGAGTIVKRLRMNWRTYLFPFILSGLVSMAIIDAFFLGAVIRLDYFFEARYFVPISGMVLGNSLNHNIVGLTTYFGSLSQKKELYYFLLTNSGSRRQTLLPFIQDALVNGLNPLLANMSVIGLISLPGMMTGQILGGASPAAAIRYQVMIMVAIFAGCTMTLVLSILLSGRFVFDDYGNVKQ